MRTLSLACTLAALLSLSACNLVKEAIAGGPEAQPRTVASFDELQLSFSLPEDMPDPLGDEPVDWLAAEDTRFDPLFERSAVLRGRVQAAQAFRLRMQGKEDLPEYVSTAGEFAQALNAAEEEAKGLDDELTALKDQLSSKDALKAKALLNGADRAADHNQAVLLELPALLDALRDLADRA